MCVSESLPGSFYSSSIYSCEAAGGAIRNVNGNDIGNVNWDLRKQASGGAIGNVNGNAIRNVNGDLGLSGMLTGMISGMLTGT